MFGYFLEDFVHSFGAEGCFDHVGDGDGAHERGKAGIFSLQIVFESLKNVSVYHFVVVVVAVVVCFIVS